MPGVIATRVGYAGGTTHDPTYRSIGDHSETVQVDFDPGVISYADLLTMFWQDHAPDSRAPSRQYASVVFTADEAQAAEAERSKAAIEARLGRVFTEILPLDRFYLAEDYHQKYRLRHSPLDAAFQQMYPDPEDYRESTAAARVNGYLSGYGERGQLDAEIETFGLTTHEQEVLRAVTRVPVGGGSCQ